MSQKTPELKKEFQPREMPPKGLTFTKWEQDKKDFIAYYGHLVPQEKHPALIRMLSDLKECRMARLASRRYYGDTDATEPLYFDNERDLDDLLEDFAFRASTGAFDMELDGAFSSAEQGSPEGDNLELLIQYYEQESVEDRAMRRELLEPTITGAPQIVVA